jgi:hypothetical protein
MLNKINHYSAAASGVESVASSVASVASVAAGASVASAAFLGAAVALLLRVFLAGSAAVAIELP